MNYTKRKRYQGFAMVLAGAALWGISGTVAQTLFQQEAVPVGWVVTVRLLVSGLLLLAWGTMESESKTFWRVWVDPQDRIRIIFFGIAGMLGVQYTYFASIQTGNAAIATLLQFLSPVYIMIYLSVRKRRPPRPSELIALVLALIGIFLLVTNGSLHKLSVSVSAVVWGLLSGVALAFYTVYPSDLLQRHGAKVVVGWGMMIGGSGLSFINPPWYIQATEFSSAAWLYLVFVILFGTLLPFYLYMDSLRHITPTEASLLGSAEPLAAIAASVAWLHVPFHIWEGIGGICIMATVFLLTVRTADTTTESWGNSLEG